MPIFTRKSSRFEFSKARSGLLEFLLIKFVLCGRIISENIKKLRAKLGLTRDDLAKKADIKYTTLMRVESGTVNKPSVQTMAKIAKGLGVSIDDLVK